MGVYQRIQSIGANVDRFAEARFNAPSGFFPEFNWLYDAISSEKTFADLAANNTTMARIREAAAHNLVL
jgi:hypothetical protein